MARERRDIAALGGRISVVRDTESGSVELTVSIEQAPPATVALNADEVTAMNEALWGAQSFLAHSDAQERVDKVVQAADRGLRVNTVRNGKRRDGYVSVEVTQGITVRVVTLGSEATRDLGAALGPAAPPRPS
jgi:hypothetical protein